MNNTNPVLPKARFSPDQVHVITHELKSISLPVSEFDSSKDLGAYYVDMREAFKQYDIGVYGDFDEFGVPLVGWGKKAYYSAVNVAQYGFIIHHLWLFNHSDEYLEVLKACLRRLELMASEEDGMIVWREKGHSERYKMQENWASAMSQGECLSFYLRMFQITGDLSLLDKSWKIYQFLLVPVDKGGVSFYDEEGNLWLEEYPSEPHSCVLNGFIYAIYGVYDLYRVTGDTRVKETFDACIRTLTANLYKYDAGYWSYYDLHYKELVKYYYQKNVHVPQLDALYKITGLNIFDEYAQKWRKTVNSLNYIFVAIMYRVRPRIQKLMKR